MGSLVLVLLTGCDALTGRAPEPQVGASATDEMRPRSRPPGGLAPPATARTQDAFDTTTAQERAAAQTPAAAGERMLGRTVASLGSPSEPGFWLKTPLVGQEMSGRVVYPATGQSVRVTLIPIGGPATGGSRLSLPALRLLGAPLTGLSDVEVFTGG